MIGGGFAGLSAAVALAERGFRVAVLEGKPALGGRAYSFADPETGDFVDNGQHVLMGCYRETLDFLDRIGAYEQLVFHEDLEIEMLDGSRTKRGAENRAAAGASAHEGRDARLSASKHRGASERDARRIAHARDATIGDANCAA